LEDRVILQAPQRRRAIFSLLLTTILLPLAFLALGLWEQQRGADDQEALDRHRLQVAEAVSALEARLAKPRGEMDFGAQFRRNGHTYAGPIALSQAREELGNAETALTLGSYRRYLPPVVMICAAVAAGLSFITLLAVMLLGRFGRKSRDALVRGFSLARRMLPLLLSAQVLLFATSFVAVGAFEVSAVLGSGSLSAGGAKLLGIAAIAIGASLWSAGKAILHLRRTVELFKPDPLPIMGRPISAEEAPGLWRLLDDLAKRLGALRPDNVVVGLTGGFFVASGAKVLEPGGKTLSGRTLYLPLPFLPLLREDEVAAIIGHELAHFSGGDTEYSLRFLPIYAGVERSLDAVAMAGARNDGSVSILMQPALRLGVFVMDQFHHAVRHWSRQREFAADAAGAGATSAEAAARALLRTSAAVPRIAETLSAAYEQPGAAPTDIVAAVLDRAAGRGLDDPADHLQQQQPHPTDTHPPTYQRLAALNHEPGAEMLAEAAAPPLPTALSRLDAYFAEPEALCRAATADFLRVARDNAQATHEALQAAAASVETEAVALHENTRASAIVMFTAGGLFLAVALALLGLGMPGLSREEAWMVAGVASCLGLIPIAFGIPLLRRGREPYLILTPDNITVRGLDRPVAWKHVADLDMTLARGGVTTRILLAPEAAVPAQLRRSRRVKLDMKHGTVTFTAVPPRHLKAEGFADLIARYRQADMARQILEDAAKTSQEDVIASRMAPPGEDTAVPAIQADAGASRHRILPPRQGGWQQTLWALLGSAMFGAILVALSLYTLPNLISDWRIRDTARPVGNSRVTDGSCTTKLVLNICDATLSVQTKSRTVTHNVNYIFMDAHSGDYSVAVLADPEHPELATTDMALEKLWNRTITLLIGSAILLAITLAPVIAIIRRLRRREEQSRA
jgi:Zn-dependent protease with chaperone function